MRRTKAVKATFLAFFAVVLSFWLTSAESPTYKCPEGQFMCKNQKCIVGRWKCDGENDCGDNSDEDACAPKTCRPDDQFRCGNGKCIPKTWLCDEEDDCKDGKRSDEQNCGNVTCAPSAFKCNNGKCIANHWKCDGNDDCEDNSDEDTSMCSKVPARTCASDQFTCSNGHCVSNRWVCDREDDCGDKSDELQSECNSKTCANDEYRCNGKNHKCIRNEWKCDGDNDCPLADDEEGCPTTPYVPSIRICSVGMFMCKNKECILGKWKCDGESDCSDGSDETNCPKSNCSNGHFACARGGCIPANERCDGSPNCADGSDEVNCMTPPPCTEDEFKCGSTSVCISNTKLCDGKNDCPNNEDESMRCSINECLDHNGHCQHTCNDLPIGYNCSCNPGYTISADSARLCEDVDECLVYGQCSQTCINFKGGYKCTCKQGYIMEPDHKTCRAVDPAPYLLFSSQTSVRKMTVNGYSYNSIVTGRKGAVGIDFDLKTNKVFWTDPKSRKIHKANLDGTGNIQDIIGDVRVPDAIAVDWVGRKIYWTDGDLNMVEVAELDGTNRMALYTDGLDEPRAIAVDPSTGYIYWSDWGYYPRIERGAMDGTSAARRVLVNSNLGWVNGMTIDYTIDRLYWVDARLRKIETIKLDGTDRRLIALTPNEHPFAVTVFENYLYYSDWTRNDRAIRKVNKFTGKDRSVVKTLMWTHMDIKAVHPHRQSNVTSSRANACIVNNGGCSHLCLLAVAPKLATCRCPNGMNMSSNGKTCNGKPFTGQPTPAPTSSSTRGPVSVPSGQSTTASSKTSKTKPNNVAKPTKSSTSDEVHNGGKNPRTTKPTTNSGNAVVAKQKSSSSDSGPNLKLIIPIVLAILLILILAAVGYWFWRTRYRYKPSISYYKDMSTKPLEEDFDDNETTKVFDDGGPRCKVEFA